MAKSGFLWDNYAMTERKLTRKRESDQGGSPRVLRGLRTWVEISSSAVKNNLCLFRKIVKPKTKIFAVVKSNAYGHGLAEFSRLIDKYGADGFAVDGIAEARRLRKEGIDKPMFILGMTLPELFKEAGSLRATLTISNWDALKAFIQKKAPAGFHLKIDTGMRRQGFYPEEIGRLAAVLKEKNLKPAGIYTHFAAAKDAARLAPTEKQFRLFSEAERTLRRFGFKNFSRHCAATGAAVLDEKYHLDFVRIGIGLYGRAPSEKLRRQRAGFFRSLMPVFSWRTLVGEIKELRSGDAIGYDFTEKVHRAAKMAILPVGYWHGFDRGFSSRGEVLINGRRAKVLGRVSMSMTAVDVSGINCAVFDEATIIGRQDGEEITAEEAASRIDSANYELLARVNPLIKRIIV